ncbi:MAG: tail fiber domain-containing protein [Rhizobiaceae bacterium]|nr:tail fiber domain-containing protein [Rhizobiaceae bacterium]
MGSFVSDAGFSSGFDSLMNPGGFSPGGENDPFFGGAAGAAAEEAAEIQAAAALAAEQRLRGDLAPFRDVGLEAIGQFGDPFQLDRDPNRVLNNPLFQALSQQQNQQLINQQGALGRGGSGETNDLLTQNVLRLGSQFQQQDFQTQLAENQQRFGQIFNQANLGQASAAQAALQGADLSTQAANAGAAGIIGASNAQAQGGQNALSLGAGILGAVFSDIRLKDNIQYAETIDGTDLYTWEWTEEAKELVGDQEEFGPIAQILQETQPHLVSMHESGYLQVHTWQ